MTDRGEQFRDAAWNSDIQTVLAIMDDGDVSIDDVDEFGKTALVNAAGACSSVIMEALMDFSPNLEIKDDDGLTAINWSIFMEHLAGLKFLINAGSDIETRDISGQTPLTQAARMGNLPAVEILLEAGAKIDTQDSYERTALDYAKDNHHTDVADVLSKLIAQRQAEQDAALAVEKAQAHSARLSRQQSIRRYLKNKR